MTSGQAPFSEPTTAPGNGLSARRVRLTRLLLLAVPGSVVAFMPLDLLSGAQQTPGLIASRVLLTLPFAVTIWALPRVSWRVARWLNVALALISSVGIGLMCQGTGGITSPAFAFTWAVPLAIGLLFISEPLCPLVAGLSAMPVGWYLLISGGKRPIEAAYWLMVTLSATGIATAASVLYRRLHGAEDEQTAALMQKLTHMDRVATLGTMAAGIVHEVNNPLAAVLANLQLLQEELKVGYPHRMRSMVDEAAAASERIRGIVKELRSFSRAESETSPSCDLKAAVSAALTIARNQLNRTDVHVDLKFLGFVQGSEAKLAQVFLNLVVNAAQAMPEGRPGNEIRITSSLEPDGCVAVEVKDNGVGIAPEQLSRIFDPFFTTKPEGVGTGLGLWVTQGIVRAAGGEVFVSSTLGQGTTFRLMLRQAATVVSAGSDSGVRAGRFWPSQKQPPSAQ